MTIVVGQSIGCYHIVEHLGEGQMVVLATVLG